APGQFTASLQVFNGATGLGTFTVNSDANGDPVYIGALDSTGANITSAVFSITSCAAVCSDFAIDTVSMVEPVMDFAVSGSAAQTVDPGGTAKYTVTVTPVAGFDQKVSLACTGAPDTTTCSVSPNSVTPNGSQPVTATVTVTTTAPSNGLLKRSSGTF